MNPHEHMVKTVEVADNARNLEASACAQIADEEMRRIIDGAYDQGYVDAAKFIRDKICSRIKMRS